MKLNRRQLIKSAAALTLGSVLNVSGKNNIEIPHYSSVDELTADPRALEIKTGESKRSSDLILYCNLNIGHYKANVLAAWDKGVGVLAPFGNAHRFPPLNRIYENARSVGVVHVRKQLYGAVSNIAVKRDLEDRGFKNIRDGIIRTGNNHYETVALDTRSGMGYIFRDDKFLKNFDLRS